jgi:hypothetical protein
MKSKDVTGMLVYTFNPTCFGRLKQEDPLSPGVYSQGRQHSVTLSLKKKNSAYCNTKSNH